MKTRSWPNLSWIHRDKSSNGHRSHNNAVCRTISRNPARMMSNFRSRSRRGRPNWSRGQRRRSDVSCRVPSVRVRRCASGGRSRRRPRLQSASARGETAGATRQLRLDDTDGLNPHYSTGRQFDSDLEQTLAQKWERKTTDWELLRENDAFDLGEGSDDPLIPRSSIRLAGDRFSRSSDSWTPEYLESKLKKIRQADAENLLVTVSEQLDCSNDDFGKTSERVLWFKTGIHVYDLVELAEEYSI